MIAFSRSGLPLLLLALAYAELAAGQPGLSPVQLLDGLSGNGPVWRTTLLTQIRLPRLCAAFVVGLGLGAAGALLQALARNRLAGPDVLGLNDGALLALALSLVLSPAGLLGPWWCGLTGALLTAGLVVLAAGGVGSRGYRVLVVGLGVAGLLRAGFEFALATLPVFHAAGLYAISVGSLSGRGWPQVGVAAVLLLMLMAASWPLALKLTLLGLHDDSMRSLGVRPGRLRLAVLLAASGLAGVAASIGGPIGFVAIAAPTLARRLASQGQALFWTAAAIGAALVASADLLGRISAAAVEIPVGVVAGLLGGPFLLWLLMRPEPHGAA
ncbi:iron ABC transporter permease [Methylomonas sp. EFPC3]|uniref:iron ABC transporter permease n=1 Tax=Methylomonas sp. EFPC3 TaxID=3021710 RepID=UPI0024170A2A|nr:iron ABC transporter permease [Methylomonas sp. EFPC3]WFP50552.1 iron ABC transporter permease [Methylomonas sp. EFPC3]